MKLGRGRVCIHVRVKLLTLILGCSSGLSFDHAGANCLIIKEAGPKSHDVVFQP